MELSIRYPVVAGMFYPADATELSKDVQFYLNQAQDQIQNPAKDHYPAKQLDRAPKAIIAPHAGYQYSGPIAASAYVRILAEREKIHRIILLGPSHHVPLQGIAVSPASHFQTPLGNIAIDHKCIEKILNLPQVSYFEEAHRMEHSIEVHLPFLQTLLNEFTLVPLVVGDTRPDEVAEVLESLWGGDETLIVISSDLSHYHNYQDAQQLDRATANAIEHLQTENIGYEDACGRNPVNGLLKLAQKKHAHISTVDLRNSGDVSADKSRVVGYGAFILNEVGH